MKLLRVKIISAQSCGGLLDGLEVRLRTGTPNDDVFEPLCLIGPNGAGKSQFIQVIAEAFQSVFHATVRNEERAEGNRELLFEIEYQISSGNKSDPAHILVSRKSVGRKKPVVKLARKNGYDWDDCDLQAAETLELLPKKIIGYTSGANETLSLPFLVSRAAYAEEVRDRALHNPNAQDAIADTRLMLVDYGTHLEVLVSNLLMGSNEQRDALLIDARVDDLHSFRCVVQLAHSPVRKGPRKVVGETSRRGIQLTSELEIYLDRLKRCSTSYEHDLDTDTYIFDYLVNSSTRTAFKHFWSSTLDLYGALHKLAMLNDLAIPKGTRDRFKRETQLRKFASRLPEPQDEDKVFRFERVVFNAADKKGTVDYVSLSDGEHQLAQLFGTMSMVSFSNALFLLDEPESHFNPKWRVKLLSRVLELPTATGKRMDESPAARQDCLLTTHSPFVPSDMPRERVLIFSKNTESGSIETRHPDIETFGTTFDAILAECFDIRPPISDVPKAIIEKLSESNDPEVIEDGMKSLGDSVEKIMLADRVRQLKRKAKN
ncbi:restriction system-associated AAA family ATPase [Burkholderia cenocepacia]|uniref:Restriction system-associated AAA family ATPase n=1 Tax=Burkholderia cenocepacia TaxID=95486 RepID=A0A3Q9F5F7_9BURK|nr:restriction system-associated AAA family ATPase [Burkholderia cenocepacia]AZQ49527.1 restriction system-associated AAA family ATPase [Burkholderia cenocepacia]